MLHQLLLLVQSNSSDIDEPLRGFGEVPIPDTEILCDLYDADS